MNGPCLQFVSGSRDQELVAIPSSGSLVLGSGPAAHVQIADEGVASAHCMVYAHEGRFWLLDVGAGSTVHRMRLLKQTAQDLADGDVFSIGRTYVKFWQSAPQPLSAAPVASPHEPPAALVFMVATMLVGTAAFCVVALLEAGVPPLAAVSTGLTVGGLFLFFGWLLLSQLRSVARTARPPRVTKRTAPSRCGFCREGLNGEGASCPSCSVHVHGGCADELAVCPTLGCAEPVSLWSKRGVRA